MKTEPGTVLLLHFSLQNGYFMFVAGSLMQFTVATTC